MAESIVSLVVERIGDLFIREAAALYGVEGEVKRLQAQLEFMLGFLKDADVKQNQGERIRILVAQIRDVAYDADDVIDAFILKIARRGGISGTFNKFTSILTKGSHLHEIKTQIKSIQSRIADIFSNLQLCGIQFAGEGEGSSSKMEMQTWLRRSYTHSEGEDVIILEDSQRDLMAQLMKEDEQLCVVSVVGMGGLGKTTLAKQVYSHVDVKQCFDCHAWVFISQQYAPENVLSKILLKVNPSFQLGIKKMTVPDFVKELYDELQEKRYLVVLDDIWRTEAWESLKLAFPNGRKGSKVLLTTRIKDVAAYANQHSSPIELPFLTIEKGWELLSKKAFPRDMVGTQEFEEVGKEMVKKCEGLPLAIVVLGGLLATKSLHEWKVVQKSINATLQKFEQEHPYKGVNGILALSYHDLPYHLKPCFLHFANFPEDREIRKRRLIRQWIAEGFIPLPLEGEEEETMEDVAEQYLEELISRSMVQVGQRDHTGRGVKTCRIHDLMRDVCVEKARKENFLGIIQQQGSLTATSTSSNMHLTTAKSRRIAIHVHSHPTDFSELMEQGHPHNRSLSLFVKDYGYKLRRQEVRSVYKNFKLLRVLDLKEVRMSSPSKGILNLIHLRYLVLRGRCLYSQLKSIDNLRSLNTLDIRHSIIERLPNAVGKLECLRHLLVDKYVKGPNRIDRLRNLETLKWIKAKQLIKNDAVLKLTNLRNLKIEFERLEEVEAVLKSPIFRLGRLRSLVMYASSNFAFPDLEPLSQCHRLSKLRFSGEITEDRRSSRHNLEFLPTNLSGEITEDPRSSSHNLEFLPTNLAKLTFRDSHFKQDPMRMLRNLPNLRFLFLGGGSYEGSEMVCSAHGFPKLEILKLEWLDNLKEWQVEEGAMPCLNSLHMKRLDQLMMIPEGLKFVTTLQELTIQSMSTTFKNRVRVVDGVDGEDLYKVRHIPSIQFHHKQP